MQKMRAVLICLIMGFCAFAQIFELSALDWSADGTHLILVVDGRLYLSSPDLGDLQPIYPDMITDWVRFGPGNWFVFASPVEDGFALWRGFLDGREPELLYQTMHTISWPTLSADGTTVAFVEDWKDLVLLDLARGESKVVLGGDWFKATPEFLPHGRALLFAGFWAQAEEPNWEIFYFDLVTSNLVQLTADSSFDWCPRVSPDGLWVAFVSNRSGAPDIWILPLLGGVPFPVTQDPWTDAFPCWSPEGGELGYASLRLEGWEFLRAGTY